MFLVQCLLAAIAIILIAGFALILSDVDKLIKNQSLIIAQQSHHHNNLCGENSDGLLNDIIHDLKGIGTFVQDARKGCIPNLRYDDWFATKDDLARWEHAAIMDAASV